MFMLVCDVIDSNSATVLQWKISLDVEFNKYFRYGIITDFIFFNLLGIF